MTKVTINV